MQRTTHLRPLIGLGVLALVLCTTTLRDAAALPTGLLAWWSGDIDARDVSGQGKHGTLVGGAQAGVPGLIGGAFQFDGMAAFVSTPLTLPSKGTIDLWVKPANLTEDIYGIFGTFGTSNGDDRLWLNARGAKGGLGIDPNRLVVNTGSCCANEIVVPSPLLRDTWTHLALTFDYVNDNYALYINGYIAGTSTEARTKPTQLLDFGGQRSNFGQNFYWHGLMDEVHVFDHVLAPEEIADLVTAVLPSLTMYVPGDFDGDGKTDWVGLDTDKAIWQWLGSRQTWQQLPGRLDTLVVGDLDGDGRDDLAGMNNQGIWVMTNGRTWGWIPGHLDTLITGDFYGDGKQHLAGLDRGWIWRSPRLGVWEWVPGRLDTLVAGDFAGTGRETFAGLDRGWIWLMDSTGVWHWVPGWLRTLQVDRQAPEHDDLVGWNGLGCYRMQTLGVWELEPCTPLLVAGH